jgi:hypothetical protein
MVEPSATMQSNQPQIPTDQSLAPEQQQAQNTLISSLQTEAAGDTASIMARYGTKMALSGTGMAGSPAAMAAH